MSVHAVHLLYNNSSQLCRFGYEGVDFFLPSVLSDTKRETQIIKAYTNHTILTSSPQRTTPLVVSKISTHLCRPRPKLICFTQIRIIRPCTSMVEPQLLVFLKSSNSQDHLFRVPRRPPTQFTPTTVQPHFLSRDLLIQMRIVISFPRGHKNAPSDYTPKIKDTE